MADTRYLYDVGYTSCEESPFWQWWHSERMDDEALAAKVERCLVQAAIADSRQDWATLWYTTVFVSKVFEAAMIAEGFERAVFEARFSVFGWADPDDPSDWPGETTKQQKALARRIKSALGED